MLGWVRWYDGRRMYLEQERIQELDLLALYLPGRERGMKCRVSKGARLLARNGVTRVVVPPEFPWWSVLEEWGLRPVGTRALRCALAPNWVRAFLTAREIEPERAVLCLQGERESPEMALLARELCVRVRNLTFDVPGECLLETRLRREYGLPVLPARTARPDLTLRFDDGPLLTGAQFALRSGKLPPNCEILPMLSALWECGRVKTEDIRILVDFS